MQFLTTEILLLMAFVADQIQSQLSPDGKNVCLHTEKYEEKIEVEVYKVVKEKVKKWCFRFIPRTCYKTEEKRKKVKEPRVVQRTKIVPKCCSGYQEKKEQVTECMPVCLNGCKNGKCAAPNTCDCAPGFYGLECEKECPNNFWGKKCANKCDCSNNGKCHKIFGRCECEPGWRGIRCELPCQNGYYGHNCKEKCNCEDYLCNHKTGECSPSTIADHTLSSTRSQTTIKNTEIQIFTENTEQTEMSTSTTEIITSTFSTSKAKINSVSGGNLLESSGASEEMLLYSTETPAGESTTLKFQEANENENEMKLISFEEKNFSTSFETMTENVNKHENKTEEMPLSATYNIYNSTEYSIDWIIFTDSERDADINQTNNFTNERNENSESQRIVTTFYFLPSFCVISSVLITIIIIAAKWVISTYRKKASKVDKKTVMKEKFCQQEEQIKFQTENFFWVNNCTKNPVYLSDVELNNTTPILETFKPLSSDNSFISKEN